jgi:hypothetical protein
MGVLFRKITFWKQILVQGIRDRSRPVYVKRFPVPVRKKRRVKVVEERHAIVLRAV